MKKFINAVITIAARDLTKFIKDRERVAASFIFPFVFTGILGVSQQSAFGANIGYNIVLFTYIGNLASNMFQSTSQGIVSILEDRENDFAQVIFISPISRLAIILGKILGEGSVAFLSVLLTLPLIFMLNIPFDFIRFLNMLPIFALAALLGGSMGLVIVSLINSRKAADRVFSLVLFPQFFLAGIFTPVKNATGLLAIGSKLSPLTYIVDLMRGVYYLGTPEFDKVVINPIWYNLLIISIFIIVMLCVGTYLFIRSEKK